MKAPPFVGAGAGDSEGEGASEPDAAATVGSPLDFDFLSFLSLSPARFFVFFFGRSHSQSGMKESTYGNVRQL